MYDFVDVARLFLKKVRTKKEERGTDFYSL